MKKLLILAALAATMTTANAACYSEGFRSGILQKLSSKGFVNESWEGEIAMEGTKLRSIDGNVRGGNVWAFSVLDAKVAAEIETAFMKRTTVVLKYCESNPLNPTWKLYSQTPYIVVSASAN